MSATAARITVPAELAAFHERFNPESGKEWIAALPELAAEFLDRWGLRLDGPPAHGMVALVLPVLRQDGTAAALKLQPLDEESRGEPIALRAWNGAGAVRLLEQEPESEIMLLERLDGERSLASVPDGEAALQSLVELMARLHRTPVPTGLRQLADVAGKMLDDAPRAAASLADPAERRLLMSYAAAVREVADEPGDRLLHWDLHYENVLAPLPGSPREPWLAIDPKPLVGDPGFDLMPALDNRWEDVTATGDPARAVRRRFDLMTEVLGLERPRAARWTLARVLQNSLWDIEDGERALQPDQVTIAEALLPAG